MTPWRGSRAPLLRFSIVSTSIRSARLRHVAASLWRVRVDRRSQATPPHWPLLRRIVMENEKNRFPKWPGAAIALPGEPVCGVASRYDPTITCDLRPHPSDKHHSGIKHGKRYGFGPYDANKGKT